MKKHIKKAQQWTIKKIDTSWKKLRPRPNMTRFQKVWRSLLIAALAGAVAIAFITFVYASVLIVTLPNPEELRDRNLEQSTLIMDREGNLLYAIHDGENREVLDNISDVSPHLIDATIAIEDDQFYSHMGVDAPAIVRAFLAELGIGPRRGGSTITQQFVKHMFLSFERSYTRKFKEIILSLMVELKFNKDEILLMYFNTISYGGNSYGIELAADRYFEKDAKDLSIAESAMLAGIPQRPTHYSPYSGYKRSALNFELTEEYLGDRVITGETDLEDHEFIRGLLGQTFNLPNGETFYIKGRTDLVLDRMLDLDYISQEEYDAALEEALATTFPPIRYNIEAPHFVFYVKQLLEEKYGVEVVQNGGLRVYTTIDPDYQAAAEKAVEDRWQTNKDSYGADNGALVALEPSTGQILAMVGSSGFFKDEEETVDSQVNMITSKRQPGSSFKPFVYALSFLNQVSPATVLYDVPTNFGSNRPQNYDGTFSGPVSIRQALGQSRNIPAIKAYFLAGEEEEIVPFVKKFGVDSILEGWSYGYSLALGTAEMTPLELAEAYGVFANTGIHVESTPILKIENANGDVLEEWDEEKVKRTEVVDPQVAYLINDVLSDASVGFGANAHIASLKNAAKTGTSSKENENGVELPNNTWLAAYTPNIVSVSWAGNADGSAMKGNATGYSTAGPISRNFLTEVLDKMQLTTWPRPEEIREIAVSRASGKLPSDTTPSDMIATDVFASFALPTESDNSYQQVRIETITDRLATEHSPEDAVIEKSFRVHRSAFAEQYPHWQASINAWVETQDDEFLPPTESADDIHNAETASNVPEIAITSPLSLSAISPDERSQEVEVEIVDPGNGIEEVTFYLNGNKQFVQTEAPYTGNVRVPVNAAEGTILDIEVKAVDQYGYSGTSSIKLRVGSDNSNNGNGNGNNSNNGDNDDDDDSALPEEDDLVDNILDSAGL